MFGTCLFLDEENLAYTILTHNSQLMQNDVGCVQLLSSDWICHLMTFLPRLKCMLFFSFLLFLCPLIVLELIQFQGANEVWFEGLRLTSKTLGQDMEYYNKLEDPTDEENDMLDLAFGLSEKYVPLP